MTNEEIKKAITPSPEHPIPADTQHAIDLLLSENDTLIRRYNSTGVKITTDGKCLCPQCKNEVPHDRFLIPVNEFCSKCGQRLYMAGTDDRLIPTAPFIRSLHRLRWDIPPTFVRPGHKKEFVSFVTECIDKIEEIVAKNSELLKIIEQLKQDLDRTREECGQLDRNAKATQDEYKREIERLAGDLKSKHQHEVCRQVRKDIYPTGKSEPLKIVSIKKDTTALEFYICGERLVIKTEEE